MNITIWIQSNIFSLQRLSQALPQPFSPPPLTMSELPRLDNTLVNLIYYLERDIWSFIQHGSHIHWCGCSGIVGWSLHSENAWTLSIEQALGRYILLKHAFKTWPNTHYEVSCIQVWYYFNRYPRDNWYYKYLVKRAVFITAKNCVQTSFSGRCSACVRYYPSDAYHPYKYATVAISWHLLTPASSLYVLGRQFWETCWAGQPCVVRRNFGRLGCAERECLVYRSLILEVLFNVDLYLSVACATNLDWFLQGMTALLVQLWVIKITSASFNAYFTLVLSGSWPCAYGDVSVQNRHKSCRSSG